MDKVPRVQDEEVENKVIKDSFSVEIQVGF